VETVENFGRPALPTRVCGPREPGYKILWVDRHGAVECGCAKPLKTPAFVHSCAGVAGPGARVVETAVDKCRSCGRVIHITGPLSTGSGRVIHRRRVAGGKWRRRPQCQRSPAAGQVPAWMVSATSPPCGLAPLFGGGREYLPELRQRRPTFLGSGKHSRVGAALTAKEHFRRSGALTPTHLGGRCGARGTCLSRPPALQLGSAFWGWAGGWGSFSSTTGTAKVLWVQELQQR